ncbi:MAG: hypothetical protein ACI849_000376, partial [Patiriisocius sp.]
KGIEMITIIGISTRLCISVKANESDTKKI